jgi:hypothetical protein
MQEFDAVCDISLSVDMSHVSLLSTCPATFSQPLIKQPSMFIMNRLQGGETQNGANNRKRIGVK